MRLPDLLQKTALRFDRACQECLKECPAKCDRPCSECLITKLEILKSSESQQKTLPVASK